MRLLDANSANGTFLAGITRNRVVKLLRNAGSEVSYHDPHVPAFPRMRNYDIEMWRYALELKKRADDPVLGHEHVASRSATLQSVEIRLNERGLRGPALTALARGTR